MGLYFIRGERLRILLIVLPVYAECSTYFRGKVLIIIFFPERIFTDQIPICTVCPGVVKPDIVFFGESLPERFQRCLQEDFQQCDMLIIMGSSLEVQPFASLIDMYV